MPDNSSIEWHLEVMSGATQSTLRSLGATGLLDSFYLAGGTGLALRFGHRLSQDLDFFATYLFNEESLLQSLQGIAGLSVVGKAPHTLHVTIKETKITFLGYAYPVLFPLAQFGGIEVADPHDVACMKINAIASRGTKRDFIDLYFASVMFGLSQLLELFDRKYTQVRYNKVHILKSLVFFEDAEKDPMPHMLVKLDWEQVKRFFTDQISRLV